MKTLYANVNIESSSNPMIFSWGDDSDIDHETVAVEYVRVYNNATGKWQRARKVDLLRRQKTAGVIVTLCGLACPIFIPLGIWMVMTKKLVFDVF